MEENHLRERYLTHFAKKAELDVAAGSVVELQLLCLTVLFFHQNFRLIAGRDSHVDDVVKRVC